MLSQLAFTKNRVHFINRRRHHGDGRLIRINKRKIQGHPWLNPPTKLRLSNSLSHPTSSGARSEYGGSCSNSVAWWIRCGVCECCRGRFPLSNLPVTFEGSCPNERMWPPILQTVSWRTLHEVSISFTPRFRILSVFIVVWRRLFHNVFSHWRSVF